MVVALPGANVFLCMQLLDAVAKVLVGVAKGVDVTPDKVVKRYTEVGAATTRRACCSEILAVLSELACRGPCAQRSGRLRRCHDAQSCSQLQA